jgi:hypothetical protein
MAIRVRGTIVIDRKHSRRGDFNVGDLCTEIGEFEVKDSLIEEFEPGKYTGDFMIKWIEPDSFSWRGRVFVKNRAQLDAILIDDIDEQSAAPAAPPEPDPIDNPPAPPVPDASQQTGSPPASQPTQAPQPSPTTSVDSAATGSSADQDLALFGEELSAALGVRAPIKLDPTVDRQQFRAQRDRLKALAYSFDAKSQVWAVRQPEDAAV